MHEMAFTCFASADMHVSEHLYEKHETFMNVCERNVTCDVYEKDETSFGKLGSFIEKVGFYQGGITDVETCEGVGARTSTRTNKAPLSRRIFTTATR